MKKVISLFLAASIPLSGASVPFVLAHDPSTDPNLLNPNLNPTVIPASPIDQNPIPQNISRPASPAQAPKPRGHHKKAETTEKPATPPTAVSWGKEPEPWDNWRTVQVVPPPQPQEQEIYSKYFKPSIPEATTGGSPNVLCYVKECVGEGSDLYKKPGTHVPLYAWGAYHASPEESNPNSQTRIWHYQAVRIPFDLVAEKSGEKLVLYAVNTRRNTVSFKAPATVSKISFSPPKPQSTYPFVRFLNRLGIEVGDMGIDLVFVHRPQSEPTPPTPNKPPQKPPKTPPVEKPEPKPEQPGTQPPGQPNPGTGQPGSETSPKATNIDEAINNLGLGTDIEKAMTNYYLTYPDLDKNKVLDKYLKDSDPDFKEGKKDIKTAFIDAVNAGKNKADLSQAIRKNIIDTTKGFLETDPNVLNPNWLQNLNSYLNGHLAQWTPKLSQKDLLKYYCNNGWTPTPPVAVTSDNSTSSSDMSTRDQLDKRGKKNRVNEKKLKEAAAPLEKMSTEIDAQKNTAGARAALNKNYDAQNPADGSVIASAGSAKEPEVDTFCKTETERGTHYGQVPAAAKITSPPGGNKEKDEQLQKDIMGGIYGMVGFGLIGLAMFGPPGFVAGLAVGAIVGALVVHLSFK